MDTPSPISVVIATRNRLDSLREALENLRALPEQPRIIVVDNGSTDGTPDVIREAFSDVTVIALSHNLGGAARTRGVEAAQTPTVAFSDDDSWWQPGALARAAELFRQHPRLALIAARVLVGPEEWIDPTCEVMANSPLREADLPGPSVLGFVACGTIVRRDAYLAVGGFNPNMGIGGEETLLALDLMAAGWGLAYVDSIAAHHHPKQSHDRNGRQAVMIRNMLWTDWLRRPLSTVIRRTRAIVLPHVVYNVDVRHGFLQAVEGLAWVLRERWRIPDEVERARALMDGD